MNGLPFAPAIPLAHVSPRRSGIFWVALIFTWSGACAPLRIGATDAQLATGRDRASTGASVFATECARCHGQKGEGLASAFEIFGPGSLPEYPRDMSNAMVTDPQQLQVAQQTRPQGSPWRDPLRTAQDLFDFVKVHLPKSHAAQMKPEDYWAVVTFILAVRGAEVPAGGINADNAHEFPIPR
jgi:mono/diheme cytochrome c family protein